MNKACERNAGQNNCKQALGNSSQRCPRAILLKQSSKRRSALRRIFLKKTLFKKYIVEKGSISINGVSLTVSKLNSQSFEVTIIPHTLKLTNLVKLKSKDIVNVEFDMIGKYVSKLLSNR